MKTKMRLSQAIRIGSLLHPKGEGELYNRKSKTTCALGAAGATLYKDISRPTVESVMNRIEREWKYLDARCTHQEWPHHDRKLMDIIVDLNDLCHWGREEIADWVETMEDKLEVPRPPIDELAPESVSAIEDRYALQTC